ncbi:MAG: sulfatase-like hydrolase/transferase, partial [Planctomycetaceae bacterium]|nr:sulfatase-like hydrolase/transferase [Planctomycetaceae bacterium]
KKRDRPFFLYWAINVPHYPMQGTAKWREHYADLEAPRRMYAEFVSTMDERVGKVLDAVEAAGLREQTLIVFQSDHGHSTEERAFFGGGNAGPYRGAKGCLFEGGIRVPSIVSFPGVIPQDQVRDQLAVGCDWFPTLADFCEIEVPYPQIDGSSIREVILTDDAPSPHKSFYWHLGGGENPQWVVREGVWKLLGNPQDRSNTAELTNADQLFLVNLSADIGERTNVASQHPEIIQRLQQLRREYLDDISVE